MRLLLVVGFALLFLMVLQLESFPLQSPQGTPAASPTAQNISDLNLLSLRVREFWTLLQQGRKQEAIAYVDPASRNEFLKRREPEFFSFRLSQIRFEANSDVVIVTVLAVRLFPQFPNPIEWPVDERYLYRDGSWYVQIAESDDKNPFGTLSQAAPTTKPDAEMIKKIEQELSRVEIQPEKLELGEAKQSGFVQREIQFANNSALPVVVQIIQGPSNFAVNQFPIKLAPGNNVAVQLMAMTEFMQGKMDGEIVVLMKADPVEVKRIIKVEGEVKMPLNFSPFPLVFSLSPQEVIIRNTTSSEIQISDVTTSSDFMTVEWRSESDRKLPAGGTTSCVVRVDAQKMAKDWPGGMIEFRLDGVAGGRTSLKLPIERNPKAGTASQK